MKRKLIGARYPYCDKNHRNYGKGQMKNGAIFVENGNLVFEGQAFYFFRSEAFDISLPLDDIVSVEAMNLNGVMPFGVCLTMKNGQEFMFGHMNNKKLEQFILDAKDKKIEDIDRYLEEKSQKKKKVLGVFCLFLVLGIIIGAFYQGYQNNQEKLVLEEVYKINDMNIYEEEIDEDIKAKGDYGKVEKVIKDYYSEFFDARRIYSDKRAEMVLNQLTNEFLAENKGNLANLGLIEDANENEKKVNDAIDKIILMLDENYTMSLIEKEGLSQKYVDFYREHMVFEDDPETAEKWLELKNKNQEKTIAVKEMITILIENEENWYIEDDTLYMNGDLSDRYNYFYDIVFDEEEEEE